MVRRIVKPFAVEIRKSGRLNKSQWLSAGPLVASRSEQPKIKRWPGIDHEAKGSLRPPELAMEVEPPVGRISPALDRPAAFEAVRNPKKRRPQTDAVPIDEPRDDPEPLVDEETERTAPAADAEGDVAPVLRRRGRARRPRDAFRRSEWSKARLPAVVYRVGKRRRT